MTSELVEYLVEIQTGSGLEDSTGAVVTITLYTERHVVEMELRNSITYENPFGSGQIDTFKLRYSDIGNIHRISLKCDKNSNGVRDSWFVKWVNVKKVSSIPDDTRFKVQRWFSQRNGWEHEITKNIAIESMVPVEGYTKLHNTYKFRSSNSVVILRRGACIKFKLTLKRPFVESDGNFQIVLSSGERARESNGTMAIAQHQPNKVYKEMVDQGKWVFEILETAGEDIVVEMNIPASAMVGRYKMVIEYKEGGVFEYPGDIVILFNPWCKADEVYMESADDIKEYVMKQHGYVYQGNYWWPYAKEWYFGQFEDVVLHAVLYLLDKIPVEKRTSVIHISRAFSSMTNSYDNNGILQGKWVGDYSDGTVPWFWSTTPAIIQRYVDDEYSPVKYGQCWVFGAILTTLMRTLGIPCRPITNFSSAHDFDANVTIDIYEGDKNRSDSIWNFHVWNDVWFRRDDLGNNGEFDGWQAIDATPQELSSGLYQLGPAPLKALKNGQVDQVYDTRFVFAEMNGEKITWKTEEGREPWPVDRDVYAVGKSMSTKTVGSDHRIDITDEYKFKDGSLLESAVVRKALRIVEHPLVIQDGNLLSVDIIPQGKSAPYCGQTVSMELHVHNKSKEDQTIILNVRPLLIQYTGDVVYDLSTSDDQQTIYVEKETVYKTSYSILPDKYIQHMEGDESIKVHCVVSVPGTNHLATTDERIPLLKPNIKMTVHEGKTVISEEALDVNISLENPLDLPLTFCEAYIGGSALEETMYLWNLSDIPARGKFQKIYKIKPMRVGGKFKKKSLIFSFSCKPIGGFSESMRIRVSDDALY